MKKLNHFTGIWKRLKVTIWVPLPWSRYANTTLNHDNVFVNTLCSADASVKAKSQVSLDASWGHLILKMQHSTTRQAKQKISANIDHHWNKNCSFFVGKRTGFVHQKLRDFVKMTLTRVSSHWLWLESSYSVKNVTGVESSHNFSQHDLSRVRVTKNLDSSWVESLTRVTLSLVMWIWFCCWPFAKMSHWFYQPVAASARPLALWISISLRHCCSECLIFLILTMFLYMPPLLAFYSQKASFAVCFDLTTEFQPGMLNSRAGFGVKTVPLSMIFYKTLLPAQRRLIVFAYFSAW